MIRWKVERIRYRTLGTYGKWVAFPHSALPWWMDFRAETFDTYSEALAYADRKARETTVTLPRLNPHGTQKIGGTGLYSLHVDHGPHATSIYLGGWGDILIENQHLEPLGTYLLALAASKGQR